MRLAIVLIIWLTLYNLNQSKSNWDIPETTAIILDISIELHELDVITPVLDVILCGLTELTVEQSITLTGDAP